MLSAVVVAQLVKWSPLTLEIRCSNLIKRLFTVNCGKKTKIKIKRLGEAHF